MKIEIVPPSLLDPLLRKNKQTEKKNMFSSKDEDATVKCQTHGKCCIGILYAYSMFTLDIGCYAHACTC